MGYTLTDEQLAVIAAARDTKDNLLVSALAGAAKTTTLVELAKVLKGTTLSLAFNKSIALEMQKKMPANVTCSTLNSLGHRTLGQHLKKRLNLDADKITGLLRDEIFQAPEDERDDIWQNYADMKASIEYARTAGHVPDKIAADLGNKCQPLLDDQMLEERFEVDFTSTELVIIRRVLRRAFALALDGTIDFNDQLLLPAVLRCSFQPFNNVLVDEVQDLSTLNHVLIGKLVGPRRLIAVGDQNQAIYAFRGAHTSGMAEMRELFKMRELPLSCSFRCPDRVVQSVHWHTPHMTSWDGNPNNPGTVANFGVWSFADLPGSCAIICRNNAPLFSLALKLIRSGRSVNLRGRDIAAGIIKDLTGLGSAVMTQKESLEALAQWHGERLAKLRKESAMERLNDRRLCLAAFIEMADTLGEAIAAARNLFAQEGPIDMMTGHKSKGFEFEKVFILDQHLLDDDAEQDLNLRYVMHTRAKESLFFISSAECLE